MGGSGLLTASEASASSIYTSVGEFISPVTQVISVFLLIWQIYEGRKQTKLFSDVKLAIMAQFNKIGQELKRSFEDRLQEVEKQTFDRIADEVENAQNAYQKANATNDETSKALLKLRNELSALLEADRNAEILD